MAQAARTGTARGAAEQRFDGESPRALAITPATGTSGVGISQAPWNYSTLAGDRAGVTNAPSPQRARGEHKPFAEKGDREPDRRVRAGRIRRDGRTDSDL